MNLNLALNILYKEATNEDCKYSNKQKEDAYKVLKENIKILKIIKKGFILPTDFINLDEKETEVIIEWLRRK